ncbi:unnamed protein product [Blepharisma stoltei]|uniref:1-phosphatidylinositol-3-phosphate 5-kinase n=1 Tax=Blepharisma stoltei TaxID=1481888 RepID=A0AAU9JZ22_9CILI|nr:unnamed protein product [Blepharisma stoltei]
MAFDPISREMWMPESLVKECINCKKTFSAFTRRHHCKYCGGVYCSTCTKNKFQTESGVWVDRVCNKCYSYLSKPLLNHHNTMYDSKHLYNPNLLIPPEDLDHFKRALSDGGESVRSTEEISREYKVRELFEELQYESEDEKLFEIEKFMKNRVFEVLKEHNVNESWAEIVYPLTKDAVYKVCSSTQFRNDNMDLNSYIGIKKIEYKDRSFCTFVHGVVFQGTSYCDSIEMPVINPVVLLLEGNATIHIGERKSVRIENLIEEESEIMKIFLGKIKSMNVSLVVTEGNFPQELVEELSCVRIGVISNVKPKILERIARGTEGCIIRSIYCASTSTESLGRCLEYDEVSYGSSNFSILKDTANNTLSGNIVISGPDQAENKKVAMSIRRLIIEYRNALIERRTFSLFRIKPCLAIFENTVALSSYFRSYITCANKICVKANTQKIPLYSKEDTTLGNFLLSYASCGKGQCADDECKTVLGGHKFNYLKNNGMVIVSLSMSKKTGSQDILLVRECTNCKEVDQPPIQLTKAIWEYSSNKFLLNFFAPKDVFISAKCGHEYFKESRFVFHVKGIKVQMKFENNFTYEVMNINNTLDDSLYKTLKEKLFVDFRDSSQIVLDGLFRIIKELLVRLTLEMTEEDEKLPNEESWEALKTDIKSLDEEIAHELDEHSNLSVSSFQNHLQVETYRRTLFIKCCKIKMNLETLKQRLKLLILAPESNLSVMSKTSDTRRTKIRNQMYSTSFLTFDEQESDAEFSNLPSDYTSTNDELLITPQWNYLQGGNLTLPTSLENLCIPVYEQDHLSIISYILNSTQYYQEVVSPIMAQNENINEHIESLLLSGENFHFKKTFQNFEGAEPTEFAGKENLKRIYGDETSFKVTVYFAKQFHSIRMVACGTDEQFLLSISNSKKINGQLGKSQATFSLSHDCRFILKIIDKNEFSMFSGIAQNYFQHLCKNFYHLMPSKLVKTVGAFKIQHKNHHIGENTKVWALLFENLGYGMPEKSLTYDLKGTSNKRRYVKQGETRTKMDLNYLEDFRCKPITISQEMKKYFDVAIWNDTLFLSKQNIVDYSLLVIINPEFKKVAIGIIDYFEQYTFERAVESKYKKVVGTGMPTITHPKIYKKRFRATLIQRYFISFDE